MQPLQLPSALYSARYLRQNIACPSVRTKSSPNAWVPRTLCATASTKAHTSISDDGPFPPNRHFELTKAFPSHNTWLPSFRDGTNLTSLSPLQQLRRTVEQAVNEVMISPDLRVNPLPLVESVFRSYQELLQQGMLAPMDTAAIAKLITILGLSQPKPIKDAISQYMGVFSAQYITKRLPPHPHASSDLLGYYTGIGKSELALNLWEWLRQQDGRYISTTVYGDAIRCLLQLGQPLCTCEGLYEEALKRCSDESNRQMLIPGAMIPKQLQTVRGLSHDRLLCVQIFAARLRRGDWRNAYLQLDTTLRMWPDSAPNQMFKAMTKARPCHETYQVFFLCCRAGSNLRAKDLRTMLDSMVRAMTSPEDLGLNLDLARAVFGAVLAGIKSGSIVKPDGRFLDCTVKASISLLHSINVQHKGLENAIYGIVFDFLACLIDWFSAWGVAPSQAMFTILTFHSGKLRSLSLLGWARRGMEEAQLPSTDIDYMCMVSAAGEFGAGKMVKDAWKRMLRCRQQMDIDTYPSDWKTFARAAKKTGLVPYYNEQVHLLAKKGSLGAKAAKKADFIAWRFPRSDPSKSTLPVNNLPAWREVEAFFRETSILLTDVHPAKEETSKEISMINPHIWQWPGKVPESWQRTLYDEMSLNSSDILAHSVAARRGKGKSRTGVTLDKLRYHHWKSINWLLLQAEAFETRRIRFLSPTGMKSFAPGQHGIMLADGSVRPNHLPFLLEHLEDIESEADKQYTENEWREKILNLRDSDYRPPEYEEAA